MKSDCMQLYKGYLINNADKIMLNGKIYTAEASGIAEAVAIKDGLIVFVGDSQDVLRYKGEDTEIIDLNGKMVMPGLIETHIHTPGIMLTDLYKINLYGITNLEKTMSAIEYYIRNHPNVNIYYGEGYSGSIFTGEELTKGPRKERLDDICKDRPIIIESYDGHTLWLNSCAFETFNITNTTEVHGGVIEKDEKTGLLWGTLKESAAGLVPRQVYSEVQMKEAVRRFQKMLHQLGYTAMLSISSSEDPPYSVFNEMDDSGELKLHVCASVVMEPNHNIAALIEKAQDLRKKHSKGNLKIKTIKFFVDGIIESLTAFLIEPYALEETVANNYRGTFLWDMNELREAFTKSNEAGFQIHVHAIGDAATKNVLDALEYAYFKCPKGDYRNTITHLQLVNGEDIRRFKALNAIASIQPYWHLKEPNKWHEVEYALLGERAEYMYPVQSFIDEGVIVTSSSDHSVTMVPNPFLAIQMGITRNLNNSDASLYGVKPIKDMDDPRYLLNKQERASLSDMIKSFTKNSAYTLFMEDKIGTIEVGKYADMIVIDKDIFETPKLEIETIQVLETIFRGEVVYRKVC